MSLRGVLISFEGGEGCGKSTQSQLLARYLDSLGYPVVLTREPGGTALGERIRGVLLNGTDVLAPLEEFLLFSAARAHMVREVIKPALEASHVVVVDRYFHSSYAYQGGGGGLPQSYMTAVTEKVVGDCLPDRVVLLDLTPEKGLARCRNAGGSGNNASDRFESRELAFHHRVRAAFLSIAEAQPELFAVVDGSADEQTVFTSVLEEAMTAIKGKGLPSGLNLRVEDRPHRD